MYNNEDLYLYADRNNIVVEHFKIPKNKSLSVRIHNKDFIAIDESAMTNSAEERTHLAHELGHCLTGAFYEIASPLQIRGKAEKKAESWAIKKCVPKQRFIKLLKDGYEVWEIAEYFGVTEDFVKKAYDYYFLGG